MREGVVERSGYVLVVEDFEPWAKRIAYWVGCVAPVRVALTAAEARAHVMSEDTIAALVLDIGLPDGCGLGVLAEARQVRGAVPALVVSALEERENINRAYRLDARVLLKTADPGELERDVVHFVRRATMYSRSVRLATEAFCSAHGLTATEARLVRALLHGVQRDHLATRLGIAENTLKSHIKKILGKSRLLNLATVRERITAAAQRERDHAGPRGRRS